MDFKRYGFPCIDTKAYPLCDNCRETHTGEPMIALNPSIMLCPSCFSGALEVVLSDERTQGLTKQVLQATLASGGLAQTTGEVLHAKVATALEGVLPEVVNTLAEATTTAVLDELGHALEAPAAKPAKAKAAS